MPLTRRSSRYDYANYHNHEGEQIDMPTGDQPLNMDSFAAGAVPTLINFTTEDITIPPLPFRPSTTFVTVISTDRVNPEDGMPVGGRPHLTVLDLCTSVDDARDLIKEWLDDQGLTGWAWALHSSHWQGPGRIRLLPGEFVEGWVPESGQIIRAFVHEWPVLDLIRCRQ